MFKPPQGIRLRDHSKWSTPWLGIHADMGSFWDLLVERLCLKDRPGVLAYCRGVPSMYCCTFRLVSFQNAHAHLRDFVLFKRLTWLPAVATSSIQVV